MKHRALIIGTYEPWINAYRHELEDQGLAVTVIDPVDLVISAGQGVPILGMDAQSQEYDVIIPLEEDYEQLYYSVALDDTLSSATMLNRRSILEYPAFSNKFHQYQIVSKYSDLQVPVSHFSINPVQLMPRVAPDQTIAKILQSSRGRGVFKLSSAQELVQLHDEYGKRMLVQEFIPTDPVHDYRTILLDGVAIRTVQRLSPNGVTASNAVNVNLITDVPWARDFEDLCRELHLDFCGIDYIVRDGQPVILEINRFPYYKEFTEGRTVVSQVVSSLLTA